MIISLPDTFEQEIKLHNVNIPSRDTEEWYKLYNAFMDTLHKLSQDNKLNINGFVRHE